MPKLHELLSENASLFAELTVKVKVLTSNTSTLKFDEQDMMSHLSAKLQVGVVDFNYMPETKSVSLVLSNFTSPNRKPIELAVQESWHEFSNDAFPSLEIRSAEPPFGELVEASL